MLPGLGHILTRGMGDTRRVLCGVMNDLVVMDDAVDDGQGSIIGCVTACLDSLRSRGTLVVSVDAGQLATFGWLLVALPDARRVNIGAIA